jgi:hypothetical protein
MILITVISVIMAEKWEIWWKCGEMCENVGNIVERWKCAKCDGYVVKYGGNVRNMVDMCEIWWKCRKYGGNVGNMVDM